MTIEEKFKYWLQNVKSERTKGQFSKQTIGNYCSGLNILVEKCDLKEETGISSIYDITDINEFIAIEKIITSSAKFEEENKSRNNTMKSALYQYKKYLTEISNKIEDSNISEKLNLFEYNRIFFGAPGTGKSYVLDKEKDILLREGGEYERVTFHPDYSYSQFVGTYKPVVEGEKVLYKFVPGPFIRIYVKAKKNEKESVIKPYLLIIEEINRANVSSVFGDVFQLLDRNDSNRSKYPIHPTEDIRKYLVDELGGSSEEYSTIEIPNNMYIWATMNSADQGVYPMDTAFKRRWDFTYLGIDEKEEGIKSYKMIVAEKEYNWNKLRKAINQVLLEECKVNEDKLMGPYFISRNILEKGEVNNSELVKVFKNKVIMYLFDDAAKHKRAMLFSGCSTCNSYFLICQEFEKNGIEIFSKEIQNKYQRE